MNLSIIKVNNVCLIFILLCGCLSASVAQTAVSHKFLNGKLKKSSYKKLVKNAEKADVIFFGEMHNDAISHWLQLKLVKELAGKSKVVVGMEMFERDNQEALDAYVSGEIDMDKLKEQARLWNNFETDYAPIVDYAKENGISVVATNIPRPYASMVYKNGFEVLEDLIGEEKEYIAPMPIEYDPELPGYKKMLAMMDDHNGENFPKAQAIKDATMAYSISQTFQPGAKYIHLNGKYHSDNKEGIIWYLNHYKPELKVLTISTIRENEEEVKVGLADFIIVVDEDMTTTY